MQGHAEPDHVLCFVKHCTRCRAKGNKLESWRVKEGKELDYRFYEGTMGKSGNDPAATFRFLVKREKAFGAAAAAAARTHTLNAVVLKREMPALAEGAGRVVWHVASLC